MGKLIITAALCGAGTTKAQTPHVPITPDEIAADSVACVKAGASVLHIHVRDKDGANSMDTEIFVEAVGKIRAALAAEGLDAILNLTTSGSKFSEELRMGHLPVLKPEMCSYDPGTMNWANSYVFLNTPAFLEKLGKYVQELDIKPELEIFDGGMIGNINYYIKKGVLKTPCHVQFVLGVTGGMPGDAEALSYLLPKIPAGSTWSITGIGRSHIPCMLLGLAEGCDGLRVGLEDNIFFDRGVLATNAQLVARAAEFGKLAGREIANAEEARAILGVKKKV
ncbi:MAG: 3-keto-5-aminohexanoate cleavage protein [Clostridiales Family XIII bacterium]|jgi:uncharacterized protein (DUF849 family)|nr:3-keto-5-aminohexanoate cleavage protein [Clostridiales Family XIII bacterium]